MKRLWMISCILTAACGVPIRFSHVDDPTSEVKGVRYTVMRPSYAALVSLADDGTPELQVTQSLDQPVVFEATSRVNPLAETEFSFTLKDDGKLSAIMGGETDKTKEALEAALGLAKAAAAAKVGPKTKAECDAEIAAFKKKHAALAKRVDGLERTIAEVERQQPTQTRLEHLTALRAELKVAKDERDGHTLAFVHPDLGVKVAGSQYVSGSAASCIQVTLTKKQSL